MAEHKRRKHITQGSLARKLERQSTKDYDVKLESIPVIREIRSKQYKKEKKRKLVFRIALLFVMSLLVIFRYARITELGYEYNEYYNLYQEMKSENERLEVEIEKTINLANVREYAENELNMNKPEEYQIVQININKSDSTEVKEIQEEDKGLVTKTIEFFKGLLGFLE